MRNPYTGEFDYAITPPDEAELIMPSISFRTQLVPYQLVGVISPWNGPLLLSCLDPVPALFAGAAVIVKPSEVAPRFVEPLMDTIRAVPEVAEVLTFITGDGETGQRLIQRVDMLCFTGSVPNGRKVAVACAERLIPAYLELGGKDPAIVTATADLDAAATAVLRGAALPRPASPPGPAAPLAPSGAPAPYPLPSPRPRPSGASDPSRAWSGQHN